MTHPWPLLLQAFATFALTGLIWLVQIVHYPLFRAVGEDRFATYHAAHSQLITIVVGPLMLLEVAMAAWMVVAKPSTIPAAQAWFGLALVALIWLSTAMHSVPRHEELGHGFDAGAHAALVTTNWVRTVAWTTRSALLLMVLRNSLR